MTRDWSDFVFPSHSPYSTDSNCKNSKGLRILHISLWLMVWFGVKAIKGSATKDELLYQRNHILWMNNYSLITVRRVRIGVRFGNHSSEVHPLKLNASLKSSPPRSKQQNLQTQEIPWNLEYFSQQQLAQLDYFNLNTCTSSKSQGAPSCLPSDPVGIPCRNFHINMKHL